LSCHFRTPSCHSCTPRCHSREVGNLGKKPLSGPYDQAGPEEVTAGGPGYDDLELVTPAKPKGHLGQKIKRAVYEPRTGQRRQRLKHSMLKTIQYLAAGL